MNFENLKIEGELVITENEITLKNCDCNVKIIFIGNSWVTRFKIKVNTFLGMRLFKVEGLSNDYSIMQSKKPKECEPYAEYYRKRIKLLENTQPSNEPKKQFTKEFQEYLKSDKWESC